MKLDLALLVTCALLIVVRADTARPPKDDADLRRWLENMAWHHRYSVSEIQAATGLPESAITGALARWNIKPETRRARAAGAALLVLPYPGGRHPRIGFLEGAVDPQRETKLSIFAPWDEASYVVADVPEAIWSNLGLTYLAHTHVPTVWTKQNVQIEPTEWRALPDGGYHMERTLPNGIHFGTRALPKPDVVLMKTWLSNGTSQALSGLRVQNCIMLKGARGFNQQGLTNHVVRGAFVAKPADTRDRWIITAWKPINRPWANPPVPCIHADPQFPDTAPGATSTILGLVSFYAGKDVEPELRRLDAEWINLFAPLTPGRD